MADIKCPVCGEINPADQEFCQSCQSRLQPLTGTLKGADAPIHPGQMPTKKNTAELEPILPQWLRDARDKARKTAEEQTAQTAQESAPQIGASAQDLLAGLQSQSDEGEEETPDWLASITGAKPKSKKADAEPTEVHWVELGKPNEFMQQSDEPSVSATQLPTETGDEEVELPAWMTGLEPTEPGGVDELTAWLREEEKQAGSPEVKAAPLSETGSGAFDSSSPSSDALPDWLKSLQTEQAAGEEFPKTDSPSTEIESDSDWLKNLQDSNQEPAAPVSSETPDWLKKDSEPASNEPPSWARSTGAFDAAGPASEEAIPGDIPDWLKAAAPVSSVYSEESPAPTPAASGQTPDWLASLQKDGATPAFETDRSGEGAASAFTDDALAGENADAIFTEMPDWLSNVSPSETEAASSATASPAASAESIAPGDLPSWVQAMRPVESSITQAGSFSDDQTLETRGALAGLQGVLPAVPGVGPSSKPKAYSITLQASEEQQAHALLLEQILAAETSPEPIASFSPLATQRGLRWLLAILLLAVVGSVLFLRTQAFALPAGEPNDLRDARLITEALPQGAPVLVVIDYEPALAGEMEAIAAPLLEHAIILRQPVLTFISTSPTGGLLAERLFTGPLLERGYVRGPNYLNLGYLPGGLTGVRAFAQNPPLAAPFNIDLSPAWSNTPLQGVTSLSQFAAMIVITDNAESARTWIEQTAFNRGSSPIIMVSSAQAAPMIQPYYESRQVSGVVSGLHGGAIFAQSNASLPSAARNYWDAFSLGLLLAMAVILFGGLWNLFLGLRDRAAEGK